MRQRLTFLLVLLVVLGVAGGAYWLIQSNQPSADALPTLGAEEGLVEVTTQEALVGAPENEAAVEDVTIEADGTIHLDLLE